jgi:hypothetical protein
MQRSLSPIDRRFSFSIGGDKIQAALDSANTVNCGDCWVAVCLDRPSRAFHGINPEVRPAVFSHPRSTNASAFARRRLR